MLEAIDRAWIVWKARRAAALAGGLFLVVGLGAIVLPMSAGGRIFGDLVDGRFNLVLLEYFWRCVDSVLHGHAAAFVNAPFYYPWPRVTNFSDTYWGQGAPYLLARAIGASPYAALQFWFIAGFVLNYASAFWCLRRFGLGLWGSAAGAFLFTFALPVLGQSGHPNLLYRFWIPPAMLAVDRFFTQGRWTAAPAAVLLIALQLSINIYTGLFLVLLLICQTAALISVGRQAVRLPRLADLSAIRLRRCGLLLLVGLAVLLVVAIPYHNAARAYHFMRYWNNVEDGLPRIWSYLQASQSPFLPDWSARFALPAPGEQTDFPGWAAFLPLVWAFWAWRSRPRQARVMAVTWLLVTLLTLDIAHFTFFRLLYALPGFSVLRSVSRIILVSLFPLAAILGQMVDALLAEGEGRLRRRTAGGLLIALLIVEPAAGHYGMALSVWRAREAAFAARLPGRPARGAVLAVSHPPPEQNFESLNADSTIQVDAQLYAVLHGLQTLNGYSGNFPPDWRGPASCTDVGGDIRAGQVFSEIHGLVPPAVRPGQLVLVGFGACDKAALLRQPVLQPGHRYDFSGDGVSLLGAGFSDPDAGVRWTDGRDAYLVFSLARAIAGPAALSFTGRALSPNPGDAQKVDVSINDVPCGSLFFVGGESASGVVCPAYGFRAGGNVLHFDVTQPATQGLRHPGMMLETLTVRPVQRQ